ENIRVNSNIWNAFDSQSQAALLAHEFIYAPYRNMGDVTSESARRVVGRFFAAAPMPDVKEGMPAGALSCGTSIEPVNGVKPKGASTFAVYPDPKNPDGMILQFPMLFGRLTFAPLKVRLPVAYDSKQFTTHDSAFLVVKDPRANIDGNFQIEDGIFKDSFIRVRYVAGKIMEVGMTDPQGKPLFMARVLNQCGSGL
ncbi:MAG: hypothetical protein ACXVBE_13775, partial [Bdellovibrionota bacterium]